MQVIGGPYTDFANQEADLELGCAGHGRCAQAAHICVDKYARFIGSTGGILLSLLLLGVWLGLGSVMGFNKPNWWLIIGTYTGLVRLFYTSDTNGTSNSYDNDTSHNKDLE